VVYFCCGLGSIRRRDADGDYYAVARLADLRFKQEALA